MSREIKTSNGAHAMRVARKIVKPLDWGDLESIVIQSMPNEERNELFMAVSSDYLKNEDRRVRLIAAILGLANEEANKLIGEYLDLATQQTNTELQAWFQLGFAAAVQLLGTPPSMEVFEGGRETRLKGKSSL